MDLLDLMKHSGKTFLSLYTDAEHKDWVDQTRARTTFYGESPRTIREISLHAEGTQYYYLSRITGDFQESEEDFMKIRMLCLDKLSRMWREGESDLVIASGGELWTLKKVLRRFVWHDRIHGKAISRILEKQRALGLIDGYSDPFKFFLQGPF